MGLPTGFLDTNKSAFTHTFHSSFLVWPAGYLDGWITTFTIIRAAGATEAPQFALLSLDLSGWMVVLPIPTAPSPSLLFFPYPEPFVINVHEIRRKEGVY